MNQIDRKSQILNSCIQKPIKHKTQNKNNDIPSLNSMKEPSFSQSMNIDVHSYLFIIAVSIGNTVNFSDLSPNAIVVTLFKLFMLCIYIHICKL